MKYTGFVKKLLLLSIVLILSFSAMAQNKEYKWTVGLGVNAVDLRKVMFFKGFIKDYCEINKDLNVNGIPLMITADYYLNKRFTLAFSSAINNIKKCKTYEVGDPLVHEFFFSLDADLKYDMNNLLGETAWFDPFIFMGTGYVHLGEVNTFNITAGYGFNAWCTPRVGLFFNSDYNHHVGLTPTDYFQHSVGVVYRLK
jgi:predicted porin